MKFVCDMHGYSQIFPRTIGTGFMDDKDTSRTIRTGFTDRILLSHDTWEVTERLPEDSDSIDEDTQDTQAGGTQKGKGKGKADKRGKKPAVLFSAEEEQKLVDFLRDNEILYSKRLMDYKDRSKREAVWDKFCEENNLDRDACQRWFQS